LYRLILHAQQKNQNALKLWALRSRQTFKRA
jgi:hypothetical protein